MYWNDSFLISSHKTILNFKCHGNVNERFMEGKTNGFIGFRAPVVTKVPWEAFVFVNRHAGFAKRLSLLKVLQRWSFWKGKLIVLIHCQGHFSYAWALIFCKVLSPEFGRGTGCSYSGLQSEEFSFLSSCFIIQDQRLKKVKSSQWLCSPSITDCLENGFPRMCIPRDSAHISFLCINSHEEWRRSTGKQMVGISCERSPPGIRIFHLDSSKPLITLSALGETFIFDK